MGTQENMKLEELSIFLPTYNEEGNIARVVKNTVAAAEKFSEKWELTVIDDGSTDDTNEIVTALSKKERGINIVRHQRNSGYGASLKTGLYGSRYNWISYIDSDGQFDFSEIGKFIEAQRNSGADLVIGYYKQRKASLAKIVTSKIWEALVFVLFGLKVKDIDCGFKLLSKRVIDKIPKLESERGAFISSELLIKAKKEGFKIIEIPITHYPRTKGKGTGRKLNVIIQSFIDLVKLWRKLK